MTSPVRVLLVDHRLLFRKAVAALLERADGIRVDEAADCADALRRVRASKPDVVLVGTRMPGGAGIAVIRSIKAEAPKVRVVVFAGSSEETGIIAALEVGADGCLLQNVEPDEFVRMIRSAADGGTPVSPAVAARLVRLIREPTTGHPRQSPILLLTARETEVLGYIGEGFSNAQIAARLNLVDGTVKNHVHNLLDKLGFRNRVEAAAFVASGRHAGTPNHGSDTPT